MCCAVQHGLAAPRGNAPDYLNVWPKQLHCVLHLVWLAKGRCCSDLINQSCKPCIVPCMHCMTCNAINSTPVPLAFIRLNRGHVCSPSYVATMFSPAGLTCAKCLKHMHVAAARPCWLRRRRGGVLPRRQSIIATASRWCAVAATTLSWRQVLAATASRWCAVAATDAGCDGVAAACCRRADLSRRQMLAATESRRRLVAVVCCRGDRCWPRRRRGGVLLRR